MELVCSASTAPRGCDSSSSIHTEYITREKKNKEGRQRNNARKRKLQILRKQGNSYRERKERNKQIGNKFGSDKVN